MAMQDFCFDPTDAAPVVQEAAYNEPGQFDINVEDSELAIGYKQPEPATEPKPGRFQDPNSLGYY